MLNRPADFYTIQRPRQCIACIRRCLVACVILFIAACATTRTQPFLHQGDRERYGIVEQDFRTLQFYLSTEVIAHELTAGEQSAAQRVVVLADQTPGVVQEVGPNWLRVAFEAGGSGAVFLASASARGGDSLYKLATKVAGQSGYHRLEDLPEKTLLHEGRAYKIINGFDAFLQVDEKDLLKLIKRRPHVKGLRR